MQPRQPPSLLSQSLTESDLDCDGSVTRTELTLALKQVCARAFVRDRTHLTLALTQCGVSQPSPSDIDIVMGAFDRGGRGLVNIAALAHAFKEVRAGCLKRKTRLDIRGDVWTVW